MPRGFTSLEAIIGIFTFAILSIGVIGLAVIGTRLAIDSERRVVALALVNERIEFIRSLPYDDIALAPAGALTQRENIIRNQQTYELETVIQVLDPPAGLKKKIEVTARWLVPTGGTRDVQVVTLAAATPAGLSGPTGPVGQVACVPANTPSGNLHYSYNDNWLDSAFQQCVANCHDANQQLPPWQCCGWNVSYTVNATLTEVTANCQCTPPGALPSQATDHPAPGSDEYTRLARACVDGSRCTNAAGQPVAGTLYCDANCLQEPGDCVCKCPE